MGYRQPIRLENFVIVIISDTMTLYRNSDRALSLKEDKEERGAVLSSRFNHGRQIRVSVRLDL